MKKHFQAPSRVVEVSSRRPVVLRTVQAAPGQAVMEIGIDYSKTQVPERSYYADYCDVQQGRTGHSLFFGKLAPGTSKLRTKIEVSFPDDMLLRQLWNTSRDYHESVRKFAERVQLPPVERVEDTDKVQTFRANNVYLGTWGEESMMDFYYLSPRDIHLAQSQSRAELDLDPVVRIVLSTAVMFEFLEKCRPHVERLISASETQPQET
jgi:hypothetical protein